MVGHREQERRAVYPYGAQEDAPVSGREAAVAEGFRNAVPVLPAQAAAMVEAHHGSALFRHIGGDVVEDHLRTPIAVDVGDQHLVLRLRLVSRVERRQMLLPAEAMVSILEIGRASCRGSTEISLVASSV